MSTNILGLTYKNNSSTEQNVMQYVLQDTRAN
jgi:hypothetical protein